MKTKQEGKNPAAVELGKLGGAKGGYARAASLSPQRRKAIAKKAANARWNPAGKRRGLKIKSLIVLTEVSKLNQLERKQK